MNDLFGLFLGFYEFNNFEFLLLGILLLIGSMICVNLNKLLPLNKTTNYKNFLSVFDFFKDSLNFLFLRKQNLTSQENQNSSTRIFKNKINSHK
jgi:hypothetical protein